MISFIKSNTKVLSFAYFNPNIHPIGHGQLNSCAYDGYAVFSSVTMG